MLSVTKFVDAYNDYFYEQEDERVKDWFLAGSPFKIFSIILAYIYVVKVAGPSFMKHRQPYNLKKILAVYNVFQIIANAYIFYILLTSGWTDELTIIGCHQVDYSYAPKAYRMITTIWYVLMLKIFDYLETFFFVLRKKNNQVSFLHVYHHVITTLLAWLTMKWFGGGSGSFPILPNNLVHVIMYTYYLLALFGPRVQKRIHSFKKVITIIQMVQFCVILLHSLHAFRPSCHAPAVVQLFFMPNVLVFFYLFYDFYKKAYTPKVHLK